MPGRENVSPQKLKEVEDLKSTIQKYSIVGVIDLHKLPGAALQHIRYALRDKIMIKVTKKNILTRALQGIEERKELLKHLPEQPALILTNDSPFRVYSLVQKNKSKAPAKPGDIAQNDIVVSPGPTELPPGPAISALSSVKIPAKVEAGKISIMREVTVAKPGDKVSKALASALSMLKIKPMEVGLNIVAMWEDGMIYTSDVLAVDEDKIRSDISLVSQQAFNLAMNAGWITEETIEPLIAKAFIEARTLGLEAGIMDRGVIEDLLAKAERQAKALKERAGE